jgi:hypothetical protein
MARSLTAQDRSSLIRLASSLPKGSPQRKAILAGLLKSGTYNKEAGNQNTEDFIEWVLATQKPMNPTVVQRFIEAKTGREPKAPADKTPPKKGPLMVGETVLIDKTKNTNPVNVDACEAYHNRVGTIESSTSDGLVVALYKGDSDKPSTELSGDKQYFDGLTSGKGTGLYRWTPRTDYAQGAAKGTIFEAVYLKSGQTAPSARDLEMIEKYIEMGEQKGENRSRVYYTGPIVTFAYNKEGSMYFGMATAQRDYPVTMNPTDGKLLYIGVLGKRPKGWENDAAQLGLFGNSLAAK